MGYSAEASKRISKLEEERENLMNIRMEMYSILTTIQEKDQTAISPVYKHTTIREVKAKIKNLEKKIIKLELAIKRYHWK